MVCTKKIAKLVRKCINKDSKEDSLQKSYSYSSTKSYSGYLSFSSSPAGSSRGRSGSSWSQESDFDGIEHDGNTPSDVPKGSLAVYVGSEMKRFVVRAKDLHNPAFCVLLQQSEEEFGYETEGGLRLICDVDVFEKILCQIDCEWDEI